MSKHTKEPWKLGAHTDRNLVDHEDLWVVIRTNENGPDRTIIASHGFAQPDICPSYENAERIIACVNACAGIPTEELEKTRDMDSPDRLRRLAGEAAIAARR